ncbi:MAG: hypothetical protein A3K19_26485 [Lentisphaerae bacterium RIFOXYB12_FULL_65_16]|nr:MAG: hypothetical protein A3K18_08655 [Lentisphaerae bacterium RIFOXYA12_64_32]OGV87822.1 MAG: hypothetical protein A3K19_26485 [Lentisphaerae bacterium RIFOXYB12_FULL_65_16]
MHQATDGRDVGYVPVIHTEADADQIQTPKVWFDHEATERNCRTLCEVSPDMHEEFALQYERQTLSRYADRLADLVANRKLAVLKARAEV